MIEAWLRGPVQGVPAPLIPVAHALIQAKEEISRAAAGLTLEELWRSPGGGAASVGFHLRHLTGSTERLLAYGKGEGLSEAQRQALALEKDPAAPREEAGILLQRLESALGGALEQLRATDPATLADPREIGRARRPSTVLGILYHIGEHAARHSGQVVTTVRILRDG